MRSSIMVMAVVICGSLVPRVSAELQSTPVEYTHGATSLEGYLVYDDQFQGKRPGVLVVHEWWGLNEYARERANMLARLGYVAFALDMYGDGRATEHPAEARQWSSQVRENVDQWRERAAAGLEVLTNHQLVDPTNVAAIGYCFGGATVLQLAYSGQDLKAVVSFHGALQVPDEQDRQRTTASILVAHGAADPFIPSDLEASFRQALTGSGIDWMMVYYSGAQHSFTNPGADQKGIEGIAYNKSADQRSWRHMRIFLRERFRGQQD